MLKIDVLLQSLGLDPKRKKKLEDTMALAETPLPKLCDDESVNRAVGFFKSALMVGIPLCPMLPPEFRTCRIRGDHGVAWGHQADLDKLFSLKPSDPGYGDLGGQERGVIMVRVSDSVAQEDDGTLPEFPIEGFSQSGLLGGTVVNHEYAAPDWDHPYVMPLQEIRATMPSGKPIRMAYLGLNYSGNVLHFRLSSSNHNLDSWPADEAIWDSLIANSYLLSKSKLPYFSELWQACLSQKFDITHHGGSMRLTPKDTPDDCDSDDY